MTLNFLLFMCCCQYFVFGQHYRAGPPTPNETLPYWLQNGSFANLRLGQLPERTNITIIGSGASGSSCLYYLIKYLNELQNATVTTNILLLDARSASGGATGRNGGGLGVTGPNTFISTLNKYGNQSAIDRYNFTLNTYNFVLDKIEQYNLSHSLQSGYGISPLDYNQTKDEENNINIFKSYGLESQYSILNHSSTINYTHAINSYFENSIYSGNDSVFWPAKVVFGLINESIYSSNNSLNIDLNNKVNLNIQYNTTVLSVKKLGNKQWTIQTNIENTKPIITDIIIFATNGYTSYLLKDYENKIIPVKNQVIVSKAWPYYIWEKVIAGMGDDYNYYLQFIYNHKILIGGGRSNASNDNYWIGDYNDSYIDVKVSAYLQNYLSTIYPEIQQNGGLEIDIEWAGIMGFSSDNMPWIGPLKQNENNAYILAGYTGGGMDCTFGAGRVVASMITGNDYAPFPEIFLPYYPGR